MSTSLSHFSFWSAPFNSTSLFFLTHAIGQCFLEAGALFFLARVLKHWTPKWLFYSFIGASFTLLLAHFADFTIARLMDASLSYIFYHFFGSGIAHLIPAFQCLNLNGTMMMLIIGGILLIPFAGIVFYCATNTLAKFIPWKLSTRCLVSSLLITASSLLVLDFYFQPFLHRTTYAKFQKALPFGTTFLTPTPICIPLDAPIAKARDEMQTEAHLKKINAPLISKPNIFLFVIETLRKDFITEEITPELARFGQQNISFNESFSNANSTHPSWFSIFHADFPYHWTTMRDTWKHGSIPLRMLKDLGYKISIFSSADLRYFQLDELLFGKDRQLADRIEEYTETRFIEPCERDQMGLDSLLKELEKDTSHSGNVFVVFFDSTHSEYSFPADFPLRFTPISKEIDYLTLRKESLEPLKNRYRNSCAYIDSLLGKFFTKLKEKNLYDSSIIVITGDHGEEFFEEGAIFHGTHLNHYQTSVPLFYKFQQNPWTPLDSCTTHLDIFPSILHHLTGQNDFSDLFDGQSIFAPNRFPYRIAVLNNGSHAPVAFSLENGQSKYLFRFSNNAEIYKSDRLEVLFPLDSSCIEDGVFKQLLQMDKVQ